jgi:hypothetical protein
MSSTDDAIAAARNSISRSRAPESAHNGLGGAALTGAAIGAVVSLPIAGIGLVGGALIGAGVAAIDKLSKD